MEIMESREGEWNDGEKKKVAAMRALVEARDPSAKEVDDLMLRRFLRARNLDIDKAASFFLKNLKWRREALPNGFISEAEVHNELLHEKAFVQGYDKKGRPIAVFFVAKHSPSKRDIEEFKRFVVYMVERLCSSMRRGQEKFTVIADFQGWGYSNSDIRGYLAALDILQNNYPERLGKVFLVHVPYLFKKVWKIVCPFIDDNTKEKINFVADKDMRSILMEDIDESQLVKRYGGKLELVPIGASAN